jgi:F0F1-type ATP synthase membrane subunit b/b'
MSNPVTIEFTDLQAKKFEDLLDKFNETIERGKNDEPTREKQMAQLKTESQLLLAQIREEVESIKQANSQRKSFIWE